MAMPRKIPVEFGVAFPNGAYAVGEVQPVRDYDKSTRERLVQAVDPDTGLLLWSVEVVDGDPDAKKSNRTLSVKITAKVQPVLPEALTGLPFTPVEFDKLTATAYIEENGDFSKVAWSMRAADVRAPVRATKPAETKPADAKSAA
ncbi:plasmid replication, integration and excision activator [Nocardioides guangzhouensis]|uniref:Plasmid replication, integration and excision activator n=1 Tax=Nocardioides guangzhouensis TaxID=2497878 RepID=A0A4Q4ZMI5_9ACTN|nr:plasmid replication, integration and excision activator [Nocardioides guangzhouensis]RYP88674.1 plasmid replication, integration and excision activator [Nocardioides guangzhouensis]